MKALHSAFLFLYLQYCFALNIKLTQISTPFTRPVGIDYHEYTNTLILTAYYPDGSPHNFERIEFDGSHVQFSQISGLTEECKIAVVRSGNPGNFKAGDFFTGNGVVGQIVKVSPDEKLVNPWVILPGETGLMRGSLYVDPWGAWSGDLIAVTTVGNVWRINSAGQPTFVASAGNLHLEGVLTVPSDVSRYGTLAGKIIAGDEDHRRLWAFTMGNAQSWNVPVAIEDIDYVYPKQNFFGVNYSQGRLLGATADQFTGYDGEILCTQEFISGSTSGLYLLTWDSVANGPAFEAVTLDASGVNNYAGNAITQWEHVTFAPAGVLEIPPANPICYKLRNAGVDTNVSPYILPGGLSVIGWYSYNVPAATSSNFVGGLPSQSLLQGKLTMFWTIDSKNIVSLVIHVDSRGGSGGTLELELDSSNLDPRGGSLKIQDDPTTLSSSTDFADRYVWNNGQGAFSFKWGAGSSDGVVISPIPIAGTTKATCFMPKVISQTGLVSWNVISWNKTTSSFTSTSLNWGDTPSICTYDCANSCFLYSSCVSCAADPQCTWCDSTKKCLQNADPDLTTCNTKYPTLCPCSITNTSCGACTANPTGCGWCCDANGGTCVSGSSGGPSNSTCSLSNWRWGSCPSEACNPPCARGTCTCGKCVCPRTFGGPTCNETQGCDGVIGSGLVVDICGVCGGDGTSCLGCDGKPFGASYDVCGVCAGDGSSCWTRCPFDSCDVCNAAEKCGWCSNKNGPGKCVDTGIGCPSGTSLTSVCSSKAGTAEKVGLSVGIIVLIVGLLVVCLVLAGVGSKLGYDYMLKHRKGMTGSHSNPLYQNDGMEGKNPMYEDKN